MPAPKDLGDVSLSVVKQTGKLIDVAVTVSPQFTSVAPYWIGVALRWPAKLLALCGTIYQQAKAVTLAKLPAGWAGSFPIQQAGNNLNLSWAQGKAYFRATGSLNAPWQITSPARIATLHFQWAKTPADCRIEIDDLQWTSLYGWRKGAVAELTGERNGVLVVA